MSQINIDSEIAAVLGQQQLALIKASAQIAHMTQRIAQLEGELAEQRIEHTGSLLPERQNGHARQTAVEEGA